MLSSTSVAVLVYNLQYPSKNFSILLRFYTNFKAFFPFHGFFACPLLCAPVRRPFFLLFLTYFVSLVYLLYPPKITVVSLCEWVFCTRDFLWSYIVRNTSLPSSVRLEQGTSPSPLFFFPIIPEWEGDREPLPTAKASKRRERERESGVASCPRTVTTAPLPSLSLSSAQPLHDTG